MMRFYPLEKLSKLYDGYQKVVRIENEILLFIQSAGERYLIENVCPHRRMPFASTNVPASITDDIIRCPAHRFEFNLGNGANTRPGVPACGRLRLYQLAYHDDQIGVEL